MSVSSEESCFSSEEEPPCKSRRLDVDATDAMDTDDFGVAHTALPLNKKINQDTLVLIVHFMKENGLTSSLETLRNESGNEFEFLKADQFFDYVRATDFVAALTYLDQIKHLLRSSSEENMLVIKLKLLEQKFVKLLSEDKAAEATEVLRQELIPAQYPQERVQQLLTLLFSADVTEMFKNAKHRGLELNMTRFEEQLRAFFIDEVQVAEQRLATLLHSLHEKNAPLCSCHGLQQNYEPMLGEMYDPAYSCVCKAAPTRVLQVLDLGEPIEMCTFSPNGEFLVTCTQKFTNVYAIDAATMKAELRCTCSGGQFASWSTDSQQLLVGAVEKEPGVIGLWSLAGPNGLKKVQTVLTECITTAVFNEAGTRIACATHSGDISYCNLEGENIKCWQIGVVLKLKLLSDKMLIVTECEVCIVQLESSRIKICFEVPDVRIRTCTFNKSGSLVLLGLDRNGMEMWHVFDGCLGMTYANTLKFIAPSQMDCGGAKDNFIAMGDETEIRIWHAEREQPIATLVGHTERVTCISWSPMQRNILTSCSKDGTLRIWSK